MSLPINFTAKPFYWLDSKHYWDVEDLLLYGYDAIDVAAVYRAENDEEGAFDFDMYCQLLPIPQEEWAPYNTNKGHPMLEAPLEFHLKELRSVVAGQSFRRNLLIDYLSELANYSDEEQSNAQMFSDPKEAVRAGYRLLRATWKKHGRDSLAFAKALIFFGLGARPFFAPLQCQLCYRLAIPGLNRCHLHSRAKSLRTDFYGDANLQSQRARTGRKVMKRLFEKALRLENTYPDTFPLMEPEALTNILWTDYMNQDVVRKQVLAALSEAPIITTRLPHDFFALDFSVQIETLRATLDPNQDSVRLWPETIREAKKWFEEERKVSPGRQPKGMREKNRQVVAKARNLMSAGTSRTDTAKILGISTNYLTKLLQRDRKN